MSHRTVFLLACAAVGVVVLIVMRPVQPPPAPSPATRTPLPPPRVAGAPLILSTDPIRGSRDAISTIVEFADFTCPACADVEPTLGTLRQRYGPQLRIIWKDLPHLDRLTGSRRLHIAARCAQVHGKFWEYHDALLMESPRDDAALDALAVRLGLDRAAFVTCRTNLAITQLVDGDTRGAERLGVTGTPTFFVNGKPLDDAPTLDVFDAMLRSPTH